MREKYGSDDGFFPYYSRRSARRSLRRMISIIFG